MAYTHQYQAAGTFPVYHTTTVNGVTQAKDSAGSVTVWPRLEDYSKGASGGFSETVDGLEGQTRIFMDLEVGLMGVGNETTLFPPGTTEQKLGRSDLGFSLTAQCQKKLCSVNVTDSSSKGVGVRAYLSSASYVGQTDYLSSIQIDWVCSCYCAPEMDGGNQVGVTASGTKTLTVIVDGTTKAFFTETTGLITKAIGEITVYESLSATRLGMKAESEITKSVAFGRYLSSGYWVYMAGFAWDPSEDQMETLEVEVRKNWSRNETTGKLTTTGTSILLNDEWWMNSNTTPPKIGGTRVDGNPAGTGWVYVWDYMTKGGINNSTFAGAIEGDATLLTVSVPEFKYYGDPITQLWF